MAELSHEILAFNVVVVGADGKKQNCGILGAEIVNDAQRVTVNTEFRYDTEFCSNKKAFAIDPYRFPLVAGKGWETSGMPSVLEDSLPDAWGRAILAKQFNLTPAHCNPVHLLRYMTNPLGALSFEQIGHSRLKSPITAPVKFPHRNDLVVVSDGIAMWENRQLSPAVIEAIRAGSSLGGARPKVLVEDDGIGWIAKFPSKEDDFDVVRMEHLCLSVADAALVSPPAHELIEVSNKPVLLVRRFDETPSGRNHVVSLRTLLLGRNLPASYVSIAEVVRELSSNVIIDVPRLFRWMLVNVTVGNIDDHLKNFSMVHGITGWQLSPAYDITPAALANGGNGSGSHSINFTDSDIVPDSSGIVNLGRKMGLTPGQVKEGVEAVRYAVDGITGQINEVLDIDNTARFRELLRGRVAILDGATKLQPLHGLSR